ncbi:Dual specificity protein kinase TTK [Tupaia chinensis]|uniref:Dual specificity protein kinase TTK n=1 Tax=Tupaia chinensis TaxID=246437 RepID=L9L4W9_TUPCH|nr:Dual specificity protein kinase TTK [Tupaia chinensis]
MEAEDLSGRELTIDSIMNKVRDIKNKFKNEDLTDELSLSKVSADTTDNSGTVNQIMMMANNPEDWLNFLLKLEKNSVPLNDALLNKLIGRYSQAIEALPPDKYGQNESFARIQVRFAELKAIQEPDDARDYFQMARANCKKFAFVHVSFAQFELSQGNFKKSKQLLHKAVEYGAMPLEMLKIALRNLNLQKKELLTEEEKKSLSVPTLLTSQESFSSSLGHLQNRNISCDARGQATKARFLYGENMPPQDVEIGHRNPLKQSNKSKRSIHNVHSRDTPISDEKSSELISDSVTLKNKTEISLLTKLEETKEHQEVKIPEKNQKQWPSKRKSECVNQNPAASLNQGQIPEIPQKVDTEVFQVLNEKKQIHAIKYVNLEEADNQTIDSYRNEIAYLNKLQQHSDKIIRLYDYDLKPANFLIVDGMLKLIDFGIANQMQPDTTSIVKDSQISPKSDVWSLGCILYYMTYGKTPFQHIINQISKLHAIIDPNHEIEFPDIPEKDLQDVLKCCLIRNPKQRISIPELLAHPYVQIQTHPGNQVTKGTTEEMKHVLGQLVGLNSPNSILKAAKVNNLFSLLILTAFYSLVS